MMFAGPRIEEADRRHFPREVPRRDHSGRSAVGRQRLDHHCIGGGRRDHGPLDLAVEVPLHRRAAESTNDPRHTRDRQTDSARVELGCRGPWCRRRPAAVEPHLPNRQRRSRHVIDRVHAIPLALLQRHPRLDARGAEQRLDAAVLADRERDATAHARIVDRQDTLAALGARHRRPDRRGERQAAHGAEVEGLLDNAIRAGMNRLETALVVAGERRFDRFLDQPGPCRIGIGRDHPYQPRRVAQIINARNLERDRLTRSDGHPVGIAG